MLTSTLRKGFLTGLSLAALAGVSFLIVPSAKANPGGSATDSFDVTANVTQSCTITAAPDLDFGAFTQAGTKDGSTSFTVKCNASDQVTIKLESSNTCSSDVRTMTRTGGGTLSYKLFQDASKTTLWPCTTTVNHNPSNPDGDSLSVYGQIQKPSTLQPAGSYSDIVTITVTY